MDPKTGCLRVLVLWVSVSGLCPSAYADGYDVRPVTLETKGGIETITVSNPGDSKIYIETSIYDWSKDSSGKDVLTESDVAVASPPAMWIPPHGSYLVRVRFPKATGSRELPFRIMLEQVPDRAALTPGRVLIMVKQNLAAFSEPDAPVSPVLRASLQDGTLVLENTGNRHAKIDGLAQDGKQIAKGLLGYVLPGMRLDLKVPIHTGQIDLTTDLGHIPLTVK